MSTKIVIRSREGAVLGIFPSPLSSHSEQVRALVAKNPGCDYESISSVDAACAAHPAYEAEYCPLCGSAQTLGRD